MADLLIIGGGPAGNAAALEAVAAGLRDVVLVEKGELGGTCTNRGCIPTKFLLSRSAALGAGSGEAAPGWGRLIAHKGALVRGLAKSIGERCVARGVTVLGGRARLQGPHQVEVAGTDGARRTVEAAQILIATGSVPAQLPGCASDGEEVITSDDALDLARPPASLVVIGSGPVGAEFATIFRRFGAAVTIVEALPRLFPQEDAEVHELFLRRYEQLGIRVSVGDPVETVEPRPGGGRRVVLRSGRHLEADKVLVAVGRRLMSADLGVEAAGVQVGSRGEIITDAELRTSQRHIFAAGDVTGRLLLAHVASFQGVQAARRAAGAVARDVPYGAIPWATFTDPEVASVGVTEAAAIREGLAVVAGSVPLVDNIKARIDRTTEGFVKLVATRPEGRLVGGTVVGVHASDMIHVISLAIQRSMTLGELEGIVFAHPSIAESIQDLVVNIEALLNQYDTR